MYCNSLLFILMCHEKKRLLLLLLLNYTFWQYGCTCILFLVMQPRAVFIALYFVAASRFLSCVTVLWFNNWRECEAGTAKNSLQGKQRGEFNIAWDDFFFAHQARNISAVAKAIFGQAWKNDFTPLSNAPLSQAKSHLVCPIIISIQKKMPVCLFFVCLFVRIWSPNYWMDSNPIWTLWVTSIYF